MLKIVSFSRFNCVFILFMLVFCIFGSYLVSSFGMESNSNSGIGPKNDTSGQDNIENQTADSNTSKNKSIDADKSDKTNSSVFNELMNKLKKKKENIDPEYIKFFVEKFGITEDCIVKCIDENPNLSGKDLYSAIYNSHIRQPTTKYKTKNSNTTNNQDDIKKSIYFGDIARTKKTISNELAEELIKINKNLTKDEIKSLMFLGNFNEDQITQVIKNNHDKYYSEICMSILNGDSGSVNDIQKSNAEQQNIKQTETEKKQKEVYNVMPDFFNTISDEGLNKNGTKENQYKTIEKENEWNNIKNKDEDTNSKKKYINTSLSGDDDYTGECLKNNDSIDGDSVNNVIKSEGKDQDQAFNTDNKYETLIENIITKGYKEGAHKDGNFVIRHSHNNLELDNAMTEQRKSSSSSLFENIKYFSSVIVPCFITSIGGYDNTWKKLFWRFSIFRSNFWLAYGLNYNIVSDLKIPFINYNIDLDLHLLGVNVIAAIEAKLLFVTICNQDENSENYVFDFRTALNTWQFLDLEIKVCKYYSISLNILQLLA